MSQATTTPSGTAAAAAPDAVRHRRLGWRDPRIVLGLVLVSLCVLAGARVLRSADDTVPVWTLARDLPQGASVQQRDLESARVRFADAEAADRYVSAEKPLPAGSTLSRDVRAGELLPRSALAGDRTSGLVEVPLSVGTDDLPATVRQGSKVDVWVTPKATAAGAAPKATRVLTDVVVVEVPRASRLLAPDSTRQVILGIGSDRVAQIDAALGATADGRIVLARKG